MAAHVVTSAGIVVRKNGLRDKREQSGADIGATRPRRHRHPSIAPASATRALQHRELCCDDYHRSGVRDAARARESAGDPTSPPTM
ncbi:hypothetical protein [Burkholderia thailandensis]|uniref:hypothetical protein n=1 Tax=Burkholderia thailandensis TaxID=57975 RepID=UPI00016A9C37|nr:hypothetical protein [Burkholderia thailandensis]AVR10022.1 hypothetical protein A8H31_22075 [Burkholderia thailandensis]AWY57257.1 hypothetical protein A8H35_01160 [Burkholderia thailandensis]AWY68588.1 hypothetical protein A8H36_27210 [Burkholderia thailandensis]MBS2131900.1 hypothetical protein [Burkholderia thailandensis]MCS3398925.1 hypothetical protein [Burkholderia thailandensis]